MGFSKGRRQHGRQPSWLKLATANASPRMGSASEQSPFSSTQYTFSAAEASAFEEMASPTLDEIGYAKKNDLRIEEAPVNTVKHDPTFATSGLDKYYRPIDGYEGIHRFDPDFEWDPEEERRVVRKVCLCGKRRDALESNVNSENKHICANLYNHVNCPRWFLTGLCLVL